MVLSDSSALASDFDWRGHINKCSSSEEVIFLKDMLLNLMMLVELTQTVW
jgi:hypothetical protein